jgi:predicted AlkP superfamily pyrophosphatase or phosphodiesterase
MKSILMKKALIVIGLVGLLVFLPLLGQAGQKVIVNSWDGVEYDVIMPLFDQLPNLYTLGNGVMHQLTDNTQCFSNFIRLCRCMQTETMPQHATMLTGVLANKHGVTSNLCYRQVPAELTVYHDLYPAVKTAHIVTKTHFVGKPIFGGITNIVNVFYASDTITIPQVTDKVIALINQWRHEDFFIFLHFREPDVTGHIYGDTSPRYTAAIKQNDVQLGRIIDALEDNRILDQTSIYVLSDHGFGKPGPRLHSGTPNTFIVSNDLKVDDLYMVDVADLILGNFGP